MKTLFRLSSYLILSFMGVCIASATPVFTPDAPHSEYEEWHKPQYAEILLSIEEENYEEAFGHASVLAAQGDVRAITLQGAMHLYGAGVTRDYEAAIQEFLTAANQGYERAEYLLGCFYSLSMYRDFQVTLLGDDAEIDDTPFWNMMFRNKDTMDTFQDAFGWFMLADGNWGYRDIMAGAGYFYHTGAFGFTDDVKAIKWLTRAKELGSQEATQWLEEILSK